MANDLAEMTTTTLVSGAAAAAQTAITTATVDMANYLNVRFLAALGDVDNGCVLTIKAQAGMLVDGSDAVDIAGCSASGAASTATAFDNKFAELNVVRPPAGRRYVRAVITRGTANAAVVNVVADRYGARREPAPLGDVVVTNTAHG